MKFRVLPFDCLFAASFVRAANGTGCCSITVRGGILQIPVASVLAVAFLSFFRSVYLIMMTVLDTKCSRSSALL